MKSKLKLIMSMTLLVIFFIPTVVFGEEQAIPYSITPILSGTQENTAASYFDMILEPGQEEELKLLVKNNSDKEITVDITPNTARTSDSGTIDYSGIEAELSTTLPISFEKIVTGKQKVNVPANGKKEVLFKVMMPKESFDGAILGGFYVKQTNISDSKKAQEGVNINNEYAFVVGAKLAQKKEVIEPQFKLSTIKVEKWNERHTLGIKLINDAPKIMSNMTLETMIYQEDKQIKLFEKRNFSMAPNSIFHLHEVIAPSELPKGTYKLKIVIKKEDKTYALQKNFKVSTPESLAASDNVLNSDKQEYNRLYILIITILTLGLFILLTIIIYTRKKHKKR
ncbi:DUF916 domain-containing protein [Enterococcus rivorum]|uniref:Uncharacterized protein n=1 Tax=Enterococcus rivorum TaxID=762845 RepID=A0A1E5KWX5_9ENTE|nr:DUF916 domain-containing protein [Enterococcus rivorum]MBP2097277.1 hypothetical protein [Enterococcus rivorum]OEH82371.1 hypothetical protein BCR26_02770 [Enterococcus rivorum]